MFLKWNLMVSKISLDKFLVATFLLIMIAIEISKWPLFLISSILIQLSLFLLEPSNKETKPIIPGVVSKIESICFIIYINNWFFNFVWIVEYNFKLTNAVNIRVTFEKYCKETRDLHKILRI